MIKRLMKNKILWISLASSIIVLLICSKCSIFYNLNTWCDANCFMTVGKSMMDGKILYKDIYEQKGLLLFLLYGVSSLISKVSFHPVYIAEVIANTVFLYFMFKTARLFNDKISLVFIPVTNAVVCSSMFFAVGGGSEEFAMPFLAYGLYVLCKYHKSGKTNNSKSVIKYSSVVFLGISAACIFWNKYTVLGFYAGLIIALAFDYICRKKYKELLYSILFFVGGWLIISIPCFMYFVFNNAVFDLWKAYFYDNIFIYGNVPTSKIPSAYQIIENPVIIGIIILLIVTFAVYCFIRKNKVQQFLRKQKNCLIIEILITLAFTLLTTVGLGRIYKYYILPLAVFCPFVVVFINFILKINIQSIILKRSIAICLCVLCIPYMLFVSLAAEDIFKPKSQMVQYQFANTIKKLKTDKSSLLTYDWLDDGFYLTSEIEPICKYFHNYNIPLPEIKEEQHNKMNNGEIEFVVTMNQQMEKLFPQYELIQKGKQSNQEWLLYRLIKKGEK